MHGIYPAAVVTTVVATLLWGMFLRQLADQVDRKWLGLLVVMGLPLSLGAFYGVRLPLRELVAVVLGQESSAMTAYRLWEAPLTEETAKLLPLAILLLPAFRGRLTRRSVVPAAIALGLGFGLGEIWLVAQLVAESKKFADLPFYAFGGFFSERTLVCLTHAGFTVWSVLALQRGAKWLPWGLGLAMCLHFSANFPIYLANIGFAGISKEVWPILVQGWVVLFLVATLLELALLHFGMADFARLTTGRATCPSCSVIYRRPLLLALNAGFKRYERCPVCKKWHWIDARDNVARSDAETPNESGN